MAGAEVEQLMRGKVQRKGRDLYYNFEPLKYLLEQGRRPVGQFAYAARPEDCIGMTHR